MGHQQQGAVVGLVTYLLKMKRVSKRVFAIGTDVVALVGALWSALALKQDTLHPVMPAPGLWLVASLVLSVALFAYLGLYRAVIRYIAAKAVTAVASGVTIAAITIGLTDRLAGRPDIPLSVLVIFWAFAFLYVGASRFIARWVFLTVSTQRRPSARVLIYGAGRAGAELATALAVTGEFLPLGFIDDNVSLHGSVISGLEVFGHDRLAAIVENYGVTCILIALPSVSRARRREILQLLAPLGIRVQTVPDYAQIINGSARVADVRDVDPADLLGRDPIPPNVELLDACIRRKCVMVTGAGGSIGSELCRQIVRESPTRLLLLEMSEHSLYQIERELRTIAQSENIDVEIVALLGNAHHKYRVREILATFGVQTIYHAAAYKHVPIVEQNMVEGIHNNIFSTWHTAEAALECGVEVFVLVSTDKAVNPTNVMGATKRFAEIVLQGLHERGAQTRFCMVRFGNVLESSGSVVPLFREQIRSGGPVTVTHPDVIRYFMTIPEAAQLVIQASSMAQGGDVFVLDMGKPIRIADLARRMIQLTGLTVRDDENPGGDIAIRFVGLRPAEKLYEELLIGSAVTGTEHPMIMRAMEHALPWEDVAKALERLLVALRRFDCKTARDILIETVREYAPRGEIQDVVWVGHRGRPGAVQSATSKVADLDARRARLPPQSTPS